jgi:dephospho-CoA kinase
MPTAVPFNKWSTDVMVRVGITGGIGSGKSTICNVWEREGAFVIYADELAKNIMTDDPAVVDAIMQAFGEEAYLVDGSLNRPWLAKQAFTENRVGELNAIVHPAVYRESDRLMKKAESEGYPMAVREAAILLQNGRPNDLDKVVLVLADDKDRLFRVTSRDGSSTEQVSSRMSAQPDYESYLPMADVVIRNNGSIADLEDAALTLFRQLV